MYFSSPEPTTDLLQAFNLRIIRTGSIFGCRFSLVSQTFPLFPHPLD